MKWVGVFAALVIVGSVTVVAVVKQERKDRIAREAEVLRIESAAAASDAEEIARESKAYWDAKNSRAEMENAEIQLNNDKLEYDIAGLEGKPRSYSKIERDAAIVENDRLAIRLADDGDVPKLSPYEQDARISEHNRKYPRNKMADTSDITRELEDFHARVNGIIQKSNETARSLLSAITKRTKAE